MSNIRYAVLIIGALSLLLGLSLGQIYRQHQRIEQLEFNRFRQSGVIQLHKYIDGFNHFNSNEARQARERAREQAHQERLRKIEVDEVQKRLQEAIYRYNRELDKWEKTPKFESSKYGLYRFDN